MNYPSIVDETLQLRMYKTKNSYTDAQVATALTAFGWTWNEDHVTNLMAGRVKVNEEEKTYIRLFLLDRFFTYNSS